MDQSRKFPVNITLLSGNSQYGKRAEVLLQENKTSHTRLYPATPHTYTVQSFFLPLHNLIVFPSHYYVFSITLLKITDVFNWVLDIPPRSQIAGHPLRIVADNVYEDLKQRNVKHAIRGQNSHTTSLEFEINKYIDKVLSLIFFDRAKEGVELCFKFVFIPVCQCILQLLPIKEQLGNFWQLRREFAYVHICIPTQLPSSTPFFTPIFRIFVGNLWSSGIIHNINSHIHDETVYVLSSFFY